MEGMYVTGLPRACINDPVAERSAKVICADPTQLAPGRVDVRVYNNIGCNAPTLLPNATAPAVLTTNGAGWFACMRAAYG